MTTLAPGALCAAHPASAAVAVCTRCGGFFCTDCTGFAIGTERYCVRCDPGGDYVPWEDRERIGFWTAFWRTLTSLLLKPDRFFQRMPGSGGYGAPLLFAWMSWMATMVMFAVLEAAVIAGIFAFMPGPDLFGPDGPSAPLIVGIFLAVVATLAVGIVPMLFLWSLMLHVCARIFGGTGTFQASFRCHAYASGALAAGIIPMLGMTLGEVYWVVLSIFAVKHAHRVSTGRAAAIVLILPLLCCGLYLVSVVGLTALTAALAPAP